MIFKHAARRNGPRSRGAAIGFVCVTAAVTLTSCSSSVVEGSPSSEVATPHESTSAAAVDLTGAERGAKYIVPWAANASSWSTCPLKQFPQVAAASLAATGLPRLLDGKQNVEGYDSTSFWCQLQGQKLANGEQLEFDLHVEVPAQAASERSPSEFASTEFEGGRAYWEREPGGGAGCGAAWLPLDESYDIRIQVETVESANVCARLIKSAVPPTLVALSKQG